MPLLVHIPWYVFQFSQMRSRSIIVGLKVRVLGRSSLDMGRTHMVLIYGVQKFDINYGMVYEMGFGTYRDLD